MNTAHEWGKTVTAHVYSVDHMQKLIKYGIDGMEHCSLMDEETAQMIIDHDVYVVPTFCPYEEAVHYDPVMIQTKQKEYRIKLEYYKDALQAGREVIKNCKCKLGYGTDMVATTRTMRADTSSRHGWKAGWEPLGRCMPRPR